MKRLTTDDRLAWIRLSNKRKRKHLKRTEPHHFRRKPKKSLAHSSDILKAPEIFAAILIMGKYSKSKGYNNNKPLTLMRLACDQDFIFYES